MLYIDVPKRLKRVLIPNNRKFYMSSPITINQQEKAGRRTPTRRTVVPSTWVELGLTLGVLRDTMSEWKCPQCGRKFGSKQAVGTHRSQAHDNPWEDKDTLERLYCEQGLTEREIGERFGVTQTGIGNWVRKFGLDRDKPWRDKERLRNQFVELDKTREEIADEWDCSHENICRWINRHGLVKKWKQEDWLREKYYGEGLSMREMAELQDTSSSNIRRWMERHGIDRRDATNRPATFMHVKGYPTWQCARNREYVKVHRLLAVAKYGFDSVKGMDVHHKNGVRWDNRMENITLMTPGEHVRHHNKLRQEAKARR